MENILSIVNTTLKKEFEKLRTSLENEGVDSDILDKVFLGKKTVSRPPPAIFVKKKPNKPVKRPQDEKIYIVLNFNKSHAVFGNFEKEPLKGIKEERLSNLPWIKYISNRLAFGPGFTLLDRTKLPDLEAIFQDESLEYEKVERDVFQKLFTSRVQKNDSSDDSDQGSSGTTRLKARKNKWDNIQEKDTKFIFVKIQGEWVAVGTQDRKADTKGLDSVIRLTPEQEEECKKRNWSFLKPEIIENAEEDMRQKLRKILGLFHYYLVGIPYDKEGRKYSYLEVPVKSETDIGPLLKKRGLDTQFSEYFEEYYEDDVKIVGPSKILKKYKEPPETLDDKPVDWLVV